MPSPMIRHAAAAIPAARGTVSTAAPTSSVNAGSEATKLRGTNTLGSNSDQIPASTGPDSARPMSRRSVGETRGSRLRTSHSPPASTRTPTTRSTSAPGPGTFAARHVGTPVSHWPIAVPT